jgi:peptide/nickel transport system permease protein
VDAVWRKFENGLMSMRRYVAVRAAWQAGVLFVFVSLAYVVAWAVPDETVGHDPGYGGFLWKLAHGSLGRAAGGRAPGHVSPTVDSIVWDASPVTLSLLLATGVFAVSLGALLAFVTLRVPRARPVARAVSMIFVSLLPLWTGLYLAFYVGFKWHVTRIVGYCPLLGANGASCHGVGSWLGSLILPAVTLGICFAAIYGRWLAASFRQGAEEYREELEDGRDAAVARRSVRRRYRLRFAKLLSRDFGFAIGFATFVELIFELPGLGSNLVIASINLDAPVIAGVLVAASLLASVVSFVVDIACATIDPSFRRF